MLRDVLGEVLGVLAPPRCLSCGEAEAGGVLCAPCRRALPWLRGACPRCALPRPCGSPCPAALQAFAGAWAPMAHAGPARDLVVALKFRAALEAADLMAAQMAACLRAAPAAPLAAAALVVPVPPAPARRRRRGFDAADLLATRLAARLELPVARCLRRSGPATRQVGARRSERLRSGGDVVAGSPGRAPGAALLVDDVHTTGATLDSCATALSTVGIRNVLAVTYARALRRP